MINIIWANAPYLQGHVYEMAQAAVQHNIHHCSTEIKIEEIQCLKNPLQVIFMLVLANIM